MKKTSTLFDSGKNYLSVSDNLDWKFGKGKDFTICGYWDKNNKHHSCSCKNWKKCKGFKNEK